MNCYKVQIASMKPSRAEIKARIANLILRRQQHEKRIEQLLSGHHPSDRTPPSQVQQQYQHLLQLQEVVGGIGNHVNLLATVSLKTQCHLGQQRRENEVGLLWQSLDQKYSFGYVSCGLDGEGGPQWLKQLVQKVREWEMEEELFIETTNFDEKGKQYYGTRFNCGRNEEIHLSKHQLSKQEEKFVCLKGQVLFIGRLLLHRLVSLQPNINLIEALHCLFAFPRLSFSIQQSTQLLALSYILQHANPNAQRLSLYASTASSTKLLPNIVDPTLISSYSSLLRYKNISLMEEGQLSIKQIPLSCLSNHFVVLTINPLTHGIYYLSAGNTSSKKQYRMCLLDSQGQIVAWRVIKSGDSLVCQMKRQEYEVYISPISYCEEQTQELNQSKENSFELMSDKQQNFSFWLQGSGVYSRQGELSIELRLREDYNNYTLKIINSYLGAQGFALPYHNPKESQHIRLHLSLLSLTVDIFRSPFLLSVTYENLAIADQWFQNREVKIKNGDKIVLYLPVQVEKIINLTKGGERINIDMMEINI